MNNNEVKECKHQKPTFGFFLCGEYEHQMHCCDINDCYYKQNKQLTQKLEKARGALEAIYNDKYQYTCDYSDCTCWDLAQQALKELEE